MSYDLDLVDPVTRQTLHTDIAHDMRGGTYAVGGTTELSLNITYNYAKFYYYKLDAVHGIYFLNNKSGADVIPFLQFAIDELGDDVDPDYWKPTEGNAKRALCQLLAMSKMRPDGIWVVT